MSDQVDRKVVCIRYQTGNKVKKNGKTYDETRLLTVGSAFVNTNQDGSTRINGRFRAIPPGNWDGSFLILDPIRNGGEDPFPDD